MDQAVIPTPLKQDEFLFDMKGRVRNVGLPPSPANSLLPLFEAVSNSIHAIEMRFGTDAKKFGKITIEIIRRDGKVTSHPVGFKITDNGIGLNTENWRSFRTSDSELKIQRGGKGVGRLAWLKALSNCHISSVFMEDGAVWSREFDFSIKARVNSPIHNQVVKAGSDAEAGTVVDLAPFLPAYEAQCPKKFETIAAKIVGHFLKYCITDTLPLTHLVDVEDNVEIGVFYRNNQERNEIKIIRRGEDSDDEIHVYHILLNKKLKFLENGGIHWVFYAGNDRVVKETPVDGQLGLKYIGKNNDCVYIALVTGIYLDNHVNAERTAFTFGQETYDEIHKRVIEGAREFLSTYIEKVREAQIEIAEKVIRENPQFLPFRENLSEVVNTLSLNTQDEESIFVELSRKKRRARKHLESDLRSIKDGNLDELDSEVERISKAVNDEKKASLAEYVVRRKSILDLLGHYLKYSDSERAKYYKEEAVHELIVPMRSVSEDLNYDAHNLWVLDDRFAYYSYFWSDKPIKKYVKDADSSKEPDVTIISDRPLAFRREGRDEPIVIIEFKRPGRDDYDFNSSPVTQVLRYVDNFRAGTGIKDKDGAIIRPMHAGVRFICYIIADFTPTLLNVINYSVARSPTPDGRGFFGIDPDRNTTIEIIPYEKMLEDARLRNEAFFRRLELM
ncbi:ATP-binding protein [Wolbachia endosymbiont of Drosophila malagassya]|nr:ATP-binding protein [Wolbachia endosymbiont of Drosophila chauvacae]MDU8941047.1 ATP-binding protein [Wolbachia endosymbiont of Drosophila malagassya]